MALNVSFECVASILLIVKMVSCSAIFVDKIVIPETSVAPREFWLSSTPVES
jgi:hypothetical protein